MYPCSIQTLHTHALFASPLQRSDDLSVGKIRQAIAAALDGSGAAGCAGRVAQEFGDPETAACACRKPRPGHATCAYSRMTPPIRSRRRALTRIHE